MDKLYLMKVFERVIDTGSFASAARVLDLSPAAVTRAVAALEAELGTRLLNRTTRRSSLTATGELYLDRARAILRQMEEVDALVAASIAEPKGKLRLLVPHAFAVHELMRCLPDFYQEYPQVSIDLTTGECHDLADDAYDVSIQMTGGGGVLHDGFVARKFATSEAIACVAPVKAAQDGHLDHPSELSQRDCLLLQGPLFKTSFEFDRVAAARKEHVSVVPRPVMTTRHGAALVSAAEAGLGYVGLPSFVAANSLRSRALVRVLPQWHVFNYELYAVVPNRKAATAATRAFVNFLIARFGDPARDHWLPQTATSAQPKTARSSHSVAV